MRLMHLVVWFAGNTVVHFSILKKEFFVFLMNLILMNKL